MGAASQVLPSERVPMSMSTKPVRLLKRSQLLGCAFILQAAAISACATEADPGESAPTGMTTTPAQTGAGAPAASAAGSAARAGSPATAAAGRPASGAAGTPSTAPSSGAAGSAGAKATGAAVARQVQRVRPRLAAAQLAPAAVPPAPRRARRVARAVQLVAAQLLAA
jgi:hypothetical protein